MSTQHTPGTWVAKTYSTETVRDAVGIYAGSMVLPIVPDIAGRSLEECDANIRLIAAAPDLLACLLDVLDADGDLNAMDFDRYRAAIAKATGAQS
jgi:hypothetical protein